jgi:hypothetical protein
VRRSHNGKNLPINPSTDQRFIAIVERDIITEGIFKDRVRPLVGEQTDFTRSENNSLQTTVALLLSLTGHRSTSQVN